MDDLTIQASLRAVRHPDRISTFIAGQETLSQELLRPHTCHLTVDLVDIDILCILDCPAIFCKNQLVDCIRHRNIAVDVRHPILLHRDHPLPITTCSAHSTKQAVLFFSFHSNTIRQPLHIFLRPSPRETPARGSTASCCRWLPAPTLPTAVFSPAKPHARFWQKKRGACAPLRNVKVRDQNL